MLNPPRLKSQITPKTLTIRKILNILNGLDQVGTGAYTSTMKTIIGITTTTTTTETTTIIATITTIETTIAKMAIGVDAVDVEMEAVAAMAAADMAAGIDNFI
jgi:hypothetical protein